MLGRSTTVAVETADGEQTHLPTPGRSPCSGRWRMETFAELLLLEQQPGSAACPPRGQPALTHTIRMTF